jgi:phosphoribosylaminoimidazole-succinocarboxamide synthase
VGASAAKDKARSPRAARRNDPVLLKTNIPGLPLRRGKVRDIYDLTERTGRPELLIVATDRISAFDVVLPTGIPGKGRVLPALSRFWFEYLADLAATHFLTANLKGLGLSPADARALGGRAMVVRKAEVLPAECVVRGYLAGSGWREYRESGSVCGVKLPPGLRESDRLPGPIFTPTSKASAGHDQPLTFAEAVGLLGEARASEVRSKSVALYARAAEYALGRGIIIADTKLEWGLADAALGSPLADGRSTGGRLLLVDEVLTPDSSRFWPAGDYRPGRVQPSFDKQFVRDYLETLAWDKAPPAPELPPEVVERTSEKYVAAYELLTGKAFPPMGTL